MTCANYAYRRDKIKNDETYRVYYVELYADSVPDTLPTTAEGVIGFPEVPNLDKVNFEAGSFLYVNGTTADTQILYIANEQGEFVQQLS